MRSCMECPHFEKNYDDGFEVSGICTNIHSPKYCQTVFPEPLDEGCDLYVPVEEQLKSLIEERYQSVRTFCRELGIPPTTLYTVFQRGVMNANVKIIYRVCRELSISIDSLLDGFVEQK